MAQEWNQGTPEITSDPNEGHGESHGVQWRTPEFLAGLQMAIAQTFRQFNPSLNSTESQATHLEHLGGQSHGSTLTNTSVGESQVGAESDSLRQNQGTFFAPSFIITSGRTPIPSIVNATLPQSDTQPDGHEAVNAVSYLPSKSNFQNNFMRARKTRLSLVLAAHQFHQNW